MIMMVKATKRHDEASPSSIDGLPGFYFVAPTAPCSHCTCTSARKSLPTLALKHCNNNRFRDCGNTRIYATSPSYTARSNVLSSPVQLTLVLNNHNINHPPATNKRRGGRKRGKSSAAATAAAAARAKAHEAAIHFEPNPYAAAPPPKVRHRGREPDIVSRPTSDLPAEESEERYEPPLRAPVVRRPPSSPSAIASHGYGELMEVERDKLLSYSLQRRRSMRTLQSKKPRPNLLISRGPWCQSTRFASHKHQNYYNSNNFAFSWCFNLSTRPRLCRRRARLNKLDSETTKF